MRLASKLALVAPLIVCTLASTASAQGWMADRSRREGPGLRVGNLELHPGLGIEAGYDTNVFYEDEGADGSFLLRLTGHLDVSTLGAQRRSEGEATESENESNRKLDFRGGVAASYYHFFIDEARDNVALDAYLNATINPEGRFSVYLHDEFSRAIRPFVDLGGDTDGGRLTYARDRNVAGAELRLQSAGGVLKGSLGYDYTLDYFEDEAFSYVNSHQHTMRLNLSWRFLPQTALISITEATRQNYFEDGGAITLLTDNWRVRSKIGVNGALTQTLAFTAMVGYTAGFYNVADEYDNVEVEVGLKWAPTRTMNFGVGYDRRFGTSFLGNFVKRDRIYLNGQVLAGGSFMLGADVSLVFAETGIALAADGTSTLGNNAVRNDVFVNTTLFAEYRFTNWLGVNASLGYYGDFTDFEYDPAVLGGGLVPDPGGGYQKFEAWLGVRAFY